MTPTTVSYTHLDVYKRQLQERAPMKRYERQILHMGILSGKAMATSRKADSDRLYKCE